MGPQHALFGRRGASQGYALATLLSRVCAELEVDPVRNWNLDQPDTWSAIGHFSIATRTQVALSNRLPKLVKLMDNNARIISHDDATILKGEFTGMGSADFVALADVPDFYWKPKIAKQGHARSSEGPNILPIWISRTTRERHCSTFARTPRSSILANGTSSMITSSTWRAATKSARYIAGCCRFECGNCSMRWLNSRPGTSQGNSSAPRERLPITSATPASPCIFPTCMTGIRNAPSSTSSRAARTKERWKSGGSARVSMADMKT